MQHIARILQQGVHEHMSEDLSASWRKIKDDQEDEQDMQHYTYFHVLSQDARTNDRFIEKGMRYTSLGALRKAMEILRDYPCDVYIFWSDMRNIHDMRFPGPFCFCAQAYEGDEGTPCARLYWHDASNVPHEIDPCNLLAHFSRG